MLNEHIIGSLLILTHTFYCIIGTTIFICKSVATIINIEKFSRRASNNSKHVGIWGRTPRKFLKNGCFEIESEGISESHAGSCPPPNPTIHHFTPL